MCTMRHGPVRIARLTRQIPNASKKVLLESLKRPEAEGIVVRNDLSRRVLHVEYDFHEQVRDSMYCLLDCIVGWYEAHMNNVGKSKEE